MIEYFQTVVSSPYEVIGFIATILCLLSYAVKSEKKLRVISIIAGLIFIPYDVYLNAPNLITLNTICISLNFKNLYLMKKTTKKPSLSYSQQEVNES